MTTATSEATRGPDGADSQGAPEPAGDNGHAAAAARIARVGGDRRALGVNPLWMRGLRSRVRLPHLLSWGLVVLTLATFVAMLTFMTITQRELASTADAAKAALPGLLILQGIILMMMGTSAVAGGISRERDEGLLDYVRMTPMSPTSRIIGYLFGLPMREYVLFAITMPLVIAAVIVSDFSLVTLGHFYLVFFLSVWVYHMTAMVVGMVAPNPRTATMVSVGVVVVLYLVLPGLSQFGLSFFEYLTVRPTFFGLISQELPENLRSAAAAARIERFREVPLFGGSIHPTAYTLLVQSFALATMFTIVHRRWRRESSHLLSKSGATIVFAVIVAFLLASMWAIVVQDAAYRAVFERYPIIGGSERSLVSLAILMVISTGLIGIAYLTLVTVITPERATVREGWRRARKLGDGRLGIDSDAATSLPAAAIMLALLLAAGGIVLWLAARGGDYFGQAPSAPSMVGVAATLIGIGLFINGLRERFGMRLYVVVLFIAWLIPFFVAMILFAAFQANVAGSYVALPFPPAALAISISHMLETTVISDPAHVGLPFRRTLLLPSDITDEAPKLATTAAIGYLAAGMAMQVLSFVHRRRLRAIEV